MAHQSTKPRKRHVLRNVLIALLVIIVAVRLMLPYIVLRYVNKKLANMPGYYGHVEDIHIALIRGAYKIDSIYINKQDSVSGKQTPFFSARTIDLSVEWKALMHGSFVGEFEFDRPSIRFTKDKVEPKTVKDDSSSFKGLKEDLMPLQVNRVQINEGTIIYRDPNSKPKVDIGLTHVNALASNLRNSYDSAVLLPASLRATAALYEGELALNVKINPLAETPTFDLNAELKNTNLVKLNEFFQAYAKIDVNKGRFGLYTEAAAKKGSFKGYVKPIIKDLDVLGKEDRDDNILQKAWEAIVGGVGQVVKNQRKDQVATKVEFEGKIKNPNTDTWTAIGNVLQNAFIQAIQPAIDQEINIASVGEEEKDDRNFLQKLFGKKKDDDKSKDDKKDDKKQDDGDKKKDKRG